MVMGAMIFIAVVLYSVFRLCSLYQFCGGENKNICFSGCDLGFCCFWGVFDGGVLKINTRR